MTLWKHLTLSERWEDGIQHSQSLFSRGFRERGRCLLVWLHREGWIPLGEKEGQKRFNFSLAHLESVFNSCSVSLYSQYWNEESWWGQKLAEHSMNMMAMGQYPILRYGTDPWEIFRVFLLKNRFFFSCIKRDGHYKSENWTFPQPQRSSDSGKSPSPLLEGWAAHGAAFPAARQLAGSTALATKTGMCNSMSFFGNEVGGGYQS